MAYEPARWVRIARRWWVLGHADSHLGSTNAAVSHYQLTNIPCPRFGEGSAKVDEAFCKKIDSLIAARKFEAIVRVR